MGAWIDCNALIGEEKFPAWLERPAGAPTAGIVVVQEIFGVNAAMRATAERFAAAGYLAIIPDMAWRFAPHFEADPDVPDQLERAMALRVQLDPDKAVADVEAAIRTLRAQLPGGGKVGVVGYCWGGTIAFLAAAGTDADAYVGYYGRQIVEHLGEAHGIARPLLLHFGIEDPSIPPEMRARVHDGVDRNIRVTIHEHAGAGHGFAAPFGQRRNEAAASDADALTDAFLNGNLR